MAWGILILSGVCESVWATALGTSDGFRNLKATFVFVVALIASMAGLAYAMTTIPTGTAYATWVGIGAVLTAAYPIARGEETMSLVKSFLFLTLISGIVGLKVVS